MKSSNKYGIILDIVYIDDSTMTVIPDQNNAQDWLSVLTQDSSIKSVTPRPATREEYNAHCDFAEALCNALSRLDVPEELISLEKNLDFDFVKGCKLDD